MSDIHAILISARSLISNPNNWCQRFYALDERGIVCVEESPDARRWCARGAIKHVIAVESDPSTAYLDAAMALHKATLELFGELERVTHVNDGRGTKDTPSECHAKVLAIYDRAITNTSPKS